MPNASNASVLTPGQGWAPSLPLISKLVFSDQELKNLLLRAKTGLKVGDHQKEAHLLFYIGIMNENKKNWPKVGIIMRG